MSIAVPRASGKPKQPIHYRPVQKEGLSIHYRLKSSGSSFIKIAQNLSVQAPTVSNVVSGRRRSARIESEIARILGKSSWNEVVLEARSEVQKKPVAVILKEMRQEEAARKKAFKEKFEAEMSKRIAETEIYTGEAAAAMWKQVQEKMGRGA